MARRVLVFGTNPTLCFGTLALHRIEGLRKIKVGGHTSLDYAMQRMIHTKRMACKLLHIRWCYEHKVSRFGGGHVRCEASSRVRAV